jgi:very-short-patch-repair endonuclease
MNNRFKQFKGYPKTCVKCGMDFLAGAINAETCKTCKTIGWKAICGWCNVDFKTKTNAKYCNQCFTQKEYLKGKPRSDDVKKKISDKTKRWSNSPVGIEWHKIHGKANSRKLKEYFKTPEGRAQLDEVGKYRSVLMKKKILNGEFTPNITNSFTHWNAVIKYNDEIRKFRSSWEACVWLSNRHLKYESIRVPLQSGGCAITDFVDEELKIIYEIKPRSFWAKQKDKMNAIIEYSLNNGYKFIWINEQNILDYIDIELFTDDFNKKQLEVLLHGIKAN